MKNFAKILPFILLNIVISAVTILAVLFLWERYSSRFTGAPVCPTATPCPAVTQVSAETQVPVESTPAAVAASLTFPESSMTTLKIDTVVGAGDLATEAVKLLMTGTTELNLAGWELTMQDPVTLYYMEEPYVFPAIKINAGGALQVHTGPGENTVNDLYWGRDRAAWYKGVVVRLLDEKGTERSHFAIP